MYSHIAEEEDTEMVERCRKDAGGTLIFVSPHFSSQRTTPHQPGNVDWFILRIILCNCWCMLSISFTDLKPNSQDTSSRVQAELRQGLDAFLKFGLRISLSQSAHHLFECGQSGTRAFCGFGISQQCFQ
jgi:hypothetical protein